MTEKDKPAKAGKVTETKEERRAAALRANLRRRKAQARGRRVDAKSQAGDANSDDTSVS